MIVVMCLVFEDSKGVGGKQDKKLRFFFEIS